MVDGLTLRRIRQLNNKTQSQVAEACGVTPRFIKYIEHCEMNPSEEVYNAYLDFCYHGVISERAKRKKQEELEEKQKQEAIVSQKRGRTRK